MRVNKLTKLVCRSLVIGGLTLPATALIADTPAFVLGEVLSSQPASFTGTRGWQFERGGDSYDIFVTQLGVFDSGGDGLVNSHQVGLWRNDPDNRTGTLLASATVPAGTAALLEWGYRWMPITPVLLPRTLASYVVGAQYSAGDADDLVTPRPSGPWPYFQFAPDIYAITAGARVALGNDLPYPVSWWGCGEGCTPEIFWEPNFRYSLVPEPSVWVLLLPGLIYLGLRRRKVAERQR
jgi:hypothetical protein